MVRPSLYPTGSELQIGMGPNSPSGISDITPTTETVYDPTTDVDLWLDSRFIVTTHHGFWVVCNAPPPPGATEKIYPPPP